MDMFEWQMIFSILVLSPFAIIGVYKIFNWFREMFLVRKGNVEMAFLTGNRGFKFGWGKPNGDQIDYGKHKMYKFSPKKLYRHGSKPLALFNENSIEQLDPLTTQESKLDTSRLSELLIRYFNLGVISTMSKEKVMTILLIIAVAAAIGSVGLGFVNMQAMGAIDKGIQSKLADLDNKIVALTPAQVITNSTNGTVVIR